MKFAIISSNAFATVNANEFYLNKTNVKLEQNIKIRIELRTSIVMKKATLLVKCAPFQAIEIIIIQMWISA